MRFLVRLTICAIFCAMVVTQAALAGDAGDKVRVRGSESLVEAVQGASPLARSAHSAGHPSTGRMSDPPHPGIFVER
ncbi:hypothetical protein [Paenirhodobacter populi]|uniref:Uncharacterized protein n=1 Tax=Paenirhodobacter populi TaxID=2306993 RepID=A0A443IYW8_9RHOB|nr:hypothetical protein [Sinirhodobacter populi]RWR13371.1 hypothetical protein D2T33_06585 [Sinirhodobacter populi]